MLNLKGSDEFAKLAEVTNRIIAGREVIFVQNNGNWGDRLIHEGALQFLTDHQIKYQHHHAKDLEGKFKSAEYTEAAKDKVMIYGGSGAWGKYWPGSNRIISKFGDNFSEVIVFPTTFDLPKVDCTVPITYFARDKFQSQDAIPESIFCHDTAFYYSIPFKLREPQVDVGCFFRDDKEKHPAAGEFEHNVDISQLGTHTSPIRPFFEILSNFKEIWTDRLHVAIGAALMGRECRLYPNGYFKSKAIYESSMKGSFPNVQIREWAS